MQRLTGVSRADAVERNAGGLRCRCFRDQGARALVAARWPASAGRDRAAPHDADDDRVVWLEARCGPCATTRARSPAPSRSHRHQRRSTRALLLHAMEAIGHSLTSSLDSRGARHDRRQGARVMDAESAWSCWATRRRAKYRVIARGRAAEPEVRGGRLRIPIGGGPIRRACRKRAR